MFLQCDNARPHSAKLTNEKIKELNRRVIPYHPYSLDISLSDFLRKSKVLSVNPVTFCSEIIKI